MYIYQKITLLSIMILFFIFANQNCTKASEELIKAIESNDIVKVKELTAQEPALINIRFEESMTPLHIAAKKGFLEIADFYSLPVPILTAKMLIITPLSILQ